MWDKDQIAPPFRSLSLLFLPSPSLSYPIAWLINCELHSNFSHGDRSAAPTGNILFVRRQLSRRVNSNPIEWQSKFTRQGSANSPPLTPLHLTMSFDACSIVGHLVARRLPTNYARQDVANVGRTCHRMRVASCLQNAFKSQFAALTTRCVDCCLPTYSVWCHASFSPLPACLSPCIDSSSFCCCCCL